MTDDRIKEYNEILSECRRFARNEIRPGALEKDLNPETDWILGLWQKSHELDIPGLMLPEKYNGSGYPEICGAYVLDAMAMECAGVASFFAHHFAACLPLSQINGWESGISQGFLNRLRSKPLPVATVIFPNDVNDPSVSLRKEAEGIVISGKSSLAANPDLSEIYCIFIPDDLPGHHVSCVIIDKRLPGIRLGEKASLSGLKAICFRDVIFDQVKISNDAVVATGEEGKCLFDRFVNAYYGFVAAMAMGTARTAYAKALAYAKDRYQFGKMIISHQEIQRMLGAMKMKIDMGTAGYIQAFTANRVNLPGVSADGRLAKAFCTQAALEIVSDAIQIHGGYGYMNEYGLEKIMRDVKIIQLLGGRNPYHHIQVIAEEL